jgi:hypothetical protein
VRILLDRTYADPVDPQGNFATEAYVNALSQTEGLGLAVRLGNPTGLAIHNKMVLAQVGGVGYVHVGSITGARMPRRRTVNWRCRSSRMRRMPTWRPCSSGTGRPRGRSSRDTCRSLPATIARRLTIC